MKYIKISALDNLIKLYHATNYNSAKNMLKNGIGLDLKDYRNLLTKIAKEYNIPISLIEKTLKHWMRNEDPNRMEYQGGVSFFPSYDQAKKIADMYGKMGGEWKGLLLNMFIKKFALYSKKPFNSPEMKHIYDKVIRKYGGVSSNPVVVEVDLPKKFIVNKSNIGTNYELFTKSKVLNKYITKIHKV